MSRRADLTIELLEKDDKPIFLCIAESIIGEIERGRLKPADALPGTRALASTLGVHRNTVDAAYHELTMQGWLVARPSRGTFVADDLPQAPRSRSQTPTGTRPAEPSSAPQQSILHISDGAADARLLPRAELARAFRRALTTPGFLSHSRDHDPRGSLSLRSALADYLLEERGLTAMPENLMVTRGSQMGLFLAATAVLKPGEAIAVEDPGYPLAWAAFRAAGARVISVPVDTQGIDVDRLAAIAAQETDLKAVFVTPHHHYPTTVTLGAGRRLKLLDVVRKHALTLLEDDYDHDYRFEGRPVLPLMARAETDMSIIYLGSLSKLLAPAMRLGYVVTSPDLLRRMAEQRAAIDRQGDMPLEQAIASLIMEGDLRRHTRKARRIYAARRDFLAEAITQTLGDDIRFELPAGGLAIWLRLRPGISAEAWAAKAAGLGLAITPGRRFALDATQAAEAFRFGYANLDESELQRALFLLAQARPHASP